VGGGGWAGFGGLGLRGFTTAVWWCAYEGSAVKKKRARGRIRMLKRGLEKTRKKPIDPGTRAARLKKRFDRTGKKGATLKGGQRADTARVHIR